MERRLVLLPITALLTLSFLLSFYSPHRIVAPQPAVVKTKNPLFKKSCYQYVNYTADNVCCQTMKYEEKDILKCVQRLSAEPSPHPSNQSIGSSDSPVHIALVGDSHLRMLFVSLAHRVSGKHLQIRIRTGDKSWKNAQRPLQEMKKKLVKHTTEVRHLDVPLRITWYQDWELKGFPNLTKRWETNEELWPTIVIADVGFHWMKNSPHPEGLPFKGFLQELVPSFSRLASSVPVYFKAMDYVPRAFFRDRLYPGINPEAIAIYNSIAEQLLQETGVVMWDSTVPLSETYTQECLRKARVTPGTFDWNCRDNGHVGYLLVEQYSDMVYNSLCNRVLNVSGDYCDASR